VECAEGEKMLKNGNEETISDLPSPNPGGGGDGVSSFKRINHWRLRIEKQTLLNCSSFKRFRFISSRELYRTSVYNYTGPAILPGLLIFL